MLIKIVIFVLSITALTLAAQDPPKKCSDFKSDICGPKAKCYDDVSSSIYKKTGGPYCKCDANVLGKPPNCHGCKSDEGCDEAEYCDWEGNKCAKGCRFEGCPKGKFCNYDTRKCVDGCSTDAECEADEYCEYSGQKCHKICKDFSCGDNSMCKAENHLKSCSCADGYTNESGKGCRKVKTGENEDDKCDNYCGQFGECTKNGAKNSCSCLYGYRDNPLVRCVPPPAASIPGPILKPGDDDYISVALVAALAG